MLSLHSFRKNYSLIDYNLCTKKPTLLQIYKHNSIMMDNLKQLALPLRIVLTNFALAN